MLIPDVARFLEDFTPETLGTLRRRFPDAAALVRSSGLTLGSIEDDALVEAVEVMLGSVGSVVTDAVNQTSRRLRSAARLDLVGGLLGMASTGGVIVAVLGSKEPWITTVLAAVGFIASATPLVAKALRSTALGENLAPTFVQLRELAWEAEVLRSEIRRLSRESEVQLRDAITRANKLAKTAYTALNDVGYRVSFRPV